MAVSAVIHKGRLQRRLDPCYLGKIDISGKLPAVFRFKVKFLNLVSVNHHDAGFFRVGGIDKHFLRHGFRLHDPRRRRPTRGMARLVACLVRAIANGAAPAGASKPPALCLNCIARVIAVLLRRMAVGYVT